MDIAALWHPVLEPMTVGGVPLGIVAGAFLYFPIRAAVSAFRNARRTPKLRDEQQPPGAVLPETPRVAQT
jgi:uncharacterized protein (DUF2062 family)